MIRAAVPRESVASIALSRMFAEGLVLGAIGVVVFEFEGVSTEQPDRAKIAAKATVTTTGVVRIKLNLPEPTRDVILGSGVPW
jgi:hypothetical protein